MAISDLFSGGMLTSNVLLKLRVDTSDAKRGLKDLAGEEKKAAQAAIALQEQKNKQMESWAKGIAKVTVGMQLAQKAVSLLGDSWKAYEKAAKEAGGADAAKAAKFREALSAMSASVDKFAVAIGGLVAELAPLVKLAADFVGFAASIFGNSDLNRSWQEMKSSRWNNQGQWATQNAAMKPLENVQSWEGVHPSVIADSMVRRYLSTIGYAQGQSRFYEGLASGQQAGEILMGSGRRGGRGGAGDPWNLQSLLGGPNLGDAARGVGTGVDLGGRVSGSPFSSALGQGIDFSGSPVLDTDKIAQSAMAMRDMSKEYGQYQKGLLEQVFGPVNQFSLYADGFALLSDAMQGAFDAWVSGSLTAGQAIKKFFSDAISGVASQMFAQAIQHAAFAVGSIAFGDFRGAATHGKAAAMFGAGAIAVGALARQMNGGGGGSAGGGSVPSVTGGGGGGGGGGSQTHNYFIGDGFSEDGPAWRKQKAERTVRMGRGAMSTGGGVTDG